MAYEVISESPFTEEKTSTIDGFLAAFADRCEELALRFAELPILNNIDACTGEQLDRIGQLIGLTRQEAGKLIGSRELADTDEVYRLVIKYKAYINSCDCTPNDVITATKLIFGATQVTYSERSDTPATIYLSIFAPFSDVVMALLGTHDLIVHPAGVKVRTSLSAKDSDTFGFSDLNPNVAGFGKGKFAQSVM